MAKKKNRTGTNFDKLLLFAWPTRESLNLRISSVSVRFGEIVNVLYCFSLLRKKSHSCNNKRYLRIISILLAILILGLISSMFYLSTINIGFFIKFYIRSFLCMFLIALVIRKRSQVSSYFLSTLFKYIVILMSFLWAIQTLFHIRFLNLNITDDLNTFVIGGISIVRFAGTASECGYLVPILSPAVFYFCSNFKKNKVFAFLSVFLLASTTSSFALIAFVIIFFGLVYRSPRKSTFIIIALLSVFLAFLLYFSLPLFQNFVDYNINKLIVYLSFGSSNSFDFSATDRGLDIKLAIELFSKGDVFQKLFGQGTGSYYYASSLVDYLLLDDVSEANNLYFSTLTDRGLIGLILLLLLMWNIGKIKHNDTFSMSLHIGIIVQFAQYFFVGNLWLYFLWAEIAFLISYNNWLASEKNKLYSTVYYGIVSRSNFMQK